MDWKEVRKLRNDYQRGTPGLFRLFLRLSFGHVQ